MKLLFTAFVFIASALVHASNPQDCMKINNGIDRKYCVDKYLETVKNRLNSEKKAWSKGLSADDKANKTAAVEQEIQAKKDYKHLIETEMSLTEKHLEELKTVSLTAPAAAPKKKKKKKSGFRIKL